MTLELKNLTEFEEGAIYWVKIDAMGAIKTCVYENGWFQFNFGKLKALSCLCYKK